jgi:hypothetical protein
MLHRSKGVVVLKDDILGLASHGKAIVEAGLSSLQGPSMSSFHQLCPLMEESRLLRCTKMRCIASFQSHLKAAPFAYGEAGEGWKR